MFDCLDINSCHSLFFSFWSILNLITHRYRASSSYRKFTRLFFIHFYPFSFEIEIGSMWLLLIVPAFSLRGNFCWFYARCFRKRPLIKFLTYQINQCVYRFKAVLKLRLNDEIRTVLCCCCCCVWFIRYLEKWNRDQKDSMVRYAINIVQCVLNFICWFLSFFFC